MQLSEILTEMVHYSRMHHHIAHIGRVELVNGTSLLSLSEDPSQMKMSHS